MARTRYMDPAALPPIPDPQTGLPRPPHAPGRSRVAQATQSESDSAQRPAPPPGQGPVLAWYHSTRWSAIIAGLCGFAATALLVTLRDDFRFRWVHYWPLWLGLVAAGVLVGLTQWTGTECSAGAAWVRGRKAWVRTYELTHATTSVSASGVTLHLRDTADRSLAISLATVQADPLLWDLVYNGILHSVIGRSARTNGRIVFAG